jgi:hypothetical protein
MEYLVKTCRTYNGVTQPLFYVEDPTCTERGVIGKLVDTAKQVLIFRKLTDVVSDAIRSPPVMLKPKLSDKISTLHIGELAHLKSRGFYKVFESGKVQKLDHNLTFAEAKIKNLDVICIGHQR